MQLAYALFSPYLRLKKSCITSGCSVATYIKRYNQYDFMMCISSYPSL